MPSNTNKLLLSQKYSDDDFLQQKTRLEQTKQIEIREETSTDVIDSELTSLFFVPAMSSDAGTASAPSTLLA